MAPFHSGRIFKIILIVFIESISLLLGREKLSNKNLPNKFSIIYSLREDTSNSLIGGSGLLLEFQESLLLAAVDGLMAAAIVAFIVVTDVVVPEVLELELFIKFELIRGESSSLGGLTPAMTTGTLWDSQEGE